jgi:hypothetical protein
MSEPYKKARGERDKHEIALIDFKGVNVQAKRQAIQDNEFYWLENVMPIGQGNLQVCPGPSAALLTLNNETVNYTTFANVGGTDYIFAFCQSGAAYSINAVTYVSNKFASAGKFSSTGVTAIQWKNERLLIDDPNNGYFSWDNNAGLTANGGVAYVNVTTGGTGYSNSFSVTFTGGGGTGAAGTAKAVNGIIISVTMTNPGSGYTSAPTPVFTAGGGSSGAGTSYLMAGPSQGTAIAVYAGRVWVAYNRTINYTDVGTPNGFFQFAGGSSGSFTITDSTLHKNITGLVVANNFMYIFGDNSIDILGDVQIVSGATIFTRTNITAAIGTSLPNSIFPWYRAVAFAGAGGFYNLTGASPEKDSSNLDPFYSSIDFSKGVSAGQVSVNNILCTAFLVNFLDTFTPYNASRYILAMYFDKKWWFSNQVSGLTLLCSTILGGTPILFGWAGNVLYKLFSNTTSQIGTRIQTKLFDGKAPFVDKQSLKLGIGITYLTTNVQSVSASIDNEKTSNTVFTSVSNYVTWVNNTSGTVTWTNNSSDVVNWLSGGYVLSIADAPLSGGKYLGCTVVSSGYPYNLTEILIEYEEGARW